MRAPILCLTILVLVTTISTSEAATFRAYYLRPNTSVPLADSGQLTTTPFDVSGFTSNNGQQQGQWFLGSCADEATDPTYHGSCFNGGYTDFMGQVLENNTEIELCHDLYTASGDAGSCTVGGRIVGEITFDVTFTCAGQNGSVPVSLNFMAVGTAEYGLGTGDLKLSVAAGPDAGIDGVWVAEKEQLWAPLSSTGLFAGVTGDVVEYEWGSVETLDGLLGVTIDAYEVGTGSLAGSALTDENGNYAIDDLFAGDYTITIVRPLGYSRLSSGPADVSVTVSAGQTAAASWNLVCYLNGSARSVGFWKHQVGVATGGRGHAHFDDAALCNFLDLIEQHFNDNVINQVVVYAPPESGDCGDKLLVAKELLNLRGRQTMTARAKQKLMGLLLNAAAQYVALGSVISEDGATVSQAITYVDYLIDDPAGDHEKAKDICELINNGDEVPAGMILLSTPDIAYSPTRGGTPSAGELSLGQNYPNPFNPMTKIQFVVDRDQFVDLSIFNPAGHLIRTLVSGQLAQGTYVEEWNARDSNGGEISSGVYFYRLKTEQKTLSRTMILMK